MPPRPLLIALLVVVALAGCGRRGDLEEPGATTAPPAAAATPSAAMPGSGLSPLDPGSTGDANALPPPEKAPQKRFLLDFLL